MYRQVDGYPWSVPELFVAVSLLLGGVSFVTAWIITEQARAKWRLRGMVLLFAAFPIGFSLMVASWEDDFLARAKWWVEAARETEGRSSSFYHIREEEIESVERLIEDVESR